MYPQIGIISTYVLCVIVGALLGFVLNRYLALRSGQQRKDCWLTEIILLFSFGIGWLCAALLQGVYNYIAHPENGFSVFSGLTFYGGLFGGMIVFIAAYAIIRKDFDDVFARFLTYFPISLCLAHAFGRLGCFFAGCCYGKETDSFLGVMFPNMTHKVLPTQLFECVFLLLLGSALFLVYIKGKGKYNFSWYCVGYGIWRFGIEYLRGDDRGSWVPGLTPSQFWSIILIALGIVFFLLLRLNVIPKKRVINSSSL